MVKNPSKEESLLACEQMTAAGSSQKTMLLKCVCQCFINSLKLITLVVCYYILSITLTFYNKLFVKHFHLPLSLTLFHLIIKFVLSWIVRIVYEWKTQIRRVEVSWPNYVKRLAPPGIASALDIATISTCGRCLHFRWFIPLHLPFH
ncbi:Hypothetical predicted protein [Octopus vulgaris]|uniref:Uncharacterized protein n=1 Tax=Octopus vulgaris TaxID=6645 RepID=A0AA36BPE0_OCTVU|nr:Hypothetical predicted protein [Octopus vulgaris]